MSRDKFVYNMYSRRLGTMNKLKSHRQTLIDFQSKLFPSDDSSESEANVDSGINYSWAAVVIASLSQMPIAATTLYKGSSSVSRFSVGMAFVEETYRGRGVWGQMSDLIEEEARAMGAQFLIRNISSDVLFLQSSLLSRGYVFDHNAENWPTEMFKKL